MEPNQIKEIVSIFEASALSHMEIEEGSMKIKLEKPVGPAQATPVSVFTDKAPVAEKAPEKTKPAVTVTSPLVGTFYRAKSPGDKPYVQVGDTVHVGDVICMIEAMKTMNEIQSDKEGIVKEILVEDAAMVEYNQDLIILGEKE